MRLFSSLYTGRESLTSHGTALATVADNVSNANTPGFKSGRAEFNSILADNLGSLFTLSDHRAGNGVSIENITQRFNQGSFEVTGRELDAAIDGSGFFVVNDGTDTTFTRAGNFTLDENSNLLTQTGENVFGFTVGNPEQAGALSLAEAGATAEATAAVGIAGNLDNRAPIAAAIANPATFEELSAASDFSTTVQVIDSLGDIHDVAMHFFHTAANTWTAQAYLDGAEVGGDAGTPALIGGGTATFGVDGSQGDDIVNTFDITPAYSNGADAGNAAIDISNMTGFAAASSFNNITRDGFVPGNVTGVRYEDDGTIFADFDNGQEQAIGQLAIATFVSNDGLERVGNNQWRQTQTSGEADIGRAKESNRGSIKNTTIELGNTDLAREFVDMIRYQRGYQAGARVVSTSSELLNTTIQIA